MFSLLCLILLVEYSNSVTVQCSQDGEYSYKKEVISRSTTTPDKRVEQIHSLNCAGAIEFDFEATWEEERIREVDENLFQELPMVTSIKIVGAWATFLPSDIFKGSDSISSIDFTQCMWVTFDKEIRLPSALTRLILDFPGPIFDKITPDFFANHQNLKFVRISTPVRCSDDEPFSRGVFQSALNLKTLDLTNFCSKKLTKGLFSDTPSLTSLTLDHWKSLTAIDRNAFEDVTLDVLSLQGWHASSFIGEIFSGSSIDRLDLRHTKLESLYPGIFSNLKSNEIDLSSSTLTSIESGAFTNFQSKTGFSLLIPSDISCCRLEGLHELLNKTDGMRINQSIQNYTCLTPTGAEVVIEMVSNKKPSLGLSCCDYNTQYFDDVENICEVCTSVPEFCRSPSNQCQGKITRTLDCNQCNVGYHNEDNFYECKACDKASNCKLSSEECSLSDKRVLKCNQCEKGFSVDPVSGHCIACIQASADCTSYAASCIAETNQLQCATCGSGTKVGSSGACVKVGLSGTILVVVIVGTIVIVVLIAIGVTATALITKRKRKKRKLRKLCGISKKDESGIDLYPVEFGALNSPSADFPTLGENIGTTKEQDQEVIDDNEYMQMQTTTGINTTANAVDYLDLDINMATSPIDYVAVDFQKTAQVGSPKDTNNVNSLATNREYDNLTHNVNDKSSTEYLNVDLNTSASEYINIRGNASSRTDGM